MSISGTDDRRDKRDTGSRARPSVDHEKSLALIGSAVDEKLSLATPYYAGRRVLQMFLTAGRGSRALGGRGHRDDVHPLRDR